MKFTLLALALAIALVSMAAYVSAFEAHKFSVTGFLDQPLITFKTFSIADISGDKFQLHDNVDGDDDIDCDGDNDVADIANNIVRDADGNPILIPLEGETEPTETQPLDPLVAVDICFDPDSFLQGDKKIGKTKKRLCWTLTLNVVNDSNHPMTQLVVTDQFTSELDGVAKKPLRVDIMALVFNRGTGIAVKNKEAATLDVIWWVDYDGLQDSPINTPFPPENEINALNLIDDDAALPKETTPAPGSTVFGIGDTATAVMLACTKRNKLNEQEHTTQGCHTLNSGLFAQWIRDDGQRITDKFGGAPIFVAAQEGTLVQTFVPDCIAQNDHDHDENPCHDLNGDGKPDHNKHGCKPPLGLCDLGKPQALHMTYLGGPGLDDPDAHSQPVPSKASFTDTFGGPNGTDTVNIRAFKGNDTWFFGPVDPGDPFVIDATNVSGKTKLASQTFVTITEIGTDDLNVLQEIEFHTSCSQPLFASDQFGSIRLESIDFE